uniref:Uncharacterized protein n=1 Tax=Avena sativa TaxID=4498 RepID=A0ACD5VPT0_AVESA
MAASLGLAIGGHGACYYSSSHPAASALYDFQTTADPLVAADTAAAPLLNFPELLDAVRPSEYSPPALAVGSEMHSFPTSYFYNGARGYDGDAAARGRGGGGGTGSRIGFRTRSEVEVMDDGFRWRKYGKKAVKSSPNLRNYYRCSAEDRDDPRYVLTSYDGVHNHATPGSHGHSASREAAYSAPAVAPDTWTWSDLHAAAAAHSSESSY